MTDTDFVTTPAAPADAAPKRRGGLTGMVLADLRTLAGDLGISETAGMRKGDLIVAIKERQGGSASRATAPVASSRRDAAPSEAAPAPTSGATSQDPVSNGGVPTGAASNGAGSTAGTTNDVPATTAPPAAPAQADGEHSNGQAAEIVGAGQGNAAAEGPRRTRARRGASRGAGAPESADATTRTDGGDAAGGDDARQSEQSGAARTVPSGSAQPANGQNDAPAKHDGGQQRGGQQSGSQNSSGQQNGGQQNGGSNGAQNGSGGQRGQNNGQRAGGQQNGSGQGGNRGPQPDDDGDGRGRRGRRFRERRRGRDRVEAGGVQEEREVEVRDDDVLQPVAGILDVLDNYAFVRTTGYLAGPGDVYVSLGMVRKNGLRRGDALTGVVRVPREGEQAGSKQKFNPLVRIDTINGGDADSARKRPDFQKLTPLYPNQRLRLETTPNVLTTRVIDLVMPIGKGQRALIVSPPKAGKTSVLQAIANAISVNNPECHLMVVLVDERPEEVTDMQRSVKGEVISSTFDRPPGDHTAVAELAIERAKRLVEAGKDVVVLLDSITRLGRAYNNSSPASGRILSGGVDSTALYPPKRFLGAARNIEHGGSLTIIATAMVETGSTGDTVIFEEFKGTGNAELKLDRKIAERRVFPAVDVNPSGTRKDELLLGPDEYAVALKLRRVLSGLDSHQAIDLLMAQLRKTTSNAEFLMQVSKTAPMGVAGHENES